MKVSVICWTYNHEAFISDAMEGFLKQKTQYPYEIIVHDDASTDRTVEILKDYQRNFPDKIKLIIQKENLYSRYGNFQEINRQILEITKGEYIAMCEGDDYWTDPFKLEKQISYMEEHKDCTICAHESTVVNTEKKLLHESFIQFAERWRRQFFHGYGRYSSKDFLYYDVIATASTVCRRKNFEEFPREIYEAPYEDIMMRQWLAAQGYLYYMEDVMAVYRYENKDSMMGKLQLSMEGKLKNIDNTIETYEVLKKCLEKSYISEIDVIIDKLRNDRAVILDRPIEFEHKNYWVYLENVLNFCKNQEKIYIYGAGNYGKFLKEILNRNGIDTAGYIVTDINGADVEQEDIFVFSDIKEDLCDAAVVVCIEKYEYEIRKRLNDNNINNVFAFHVGKCRWKPNNDCVAENEDLFLRLRITNKCPAKCRFCGLKATPEAEQIEMDSKWYFEYLKPLYSRVKTLLITGGDALYCKNAYRYMEFVRDNYPHVTLCVESNGVLFEKKYQEYACENLSNIGFSINASNEEIFVKGCWVEPGGRNAYRMLRRNIDDYMKLLKDCGKECFAPSVSMVINKDTAEDVEAFTEMALRLKAGSIRFYFDYTESNMDGNFFSNPEISRTALVKLIELQKLLAGHVMLFFRLWLPKEEVELAEGQVKARTIEEIRNKYITIDELAEGRSIIREHEERNRLRKIAGKRIYTLEEDMDAGLMSMQIKEISVCRAPWYELDLHPSGRIDFCGWHSPLLNIKQFIKDDAVKWDEIINSEEYKSYRAAMLHGDYSGCLKSCPMNKQYRNIDSVLE